MKLSEVLLLVALYFFASFIDGAKVYASIAKSESQSGTVARTKSDSSYFLRFPHFHHPLCSKVQEYGLPCKLLSDENEFRRAALHISSCDWARFLELLTELHSAGKLNLTVCCLKACYADSTPWEHVEWLASKGAISLLFMLCELQLLPRLLEPGDQARRVTEKLAAAEETTVSDDGLFIFIRKSEWFFTAEQSISSVEDGDVGWLLRLAVRTGRCMLLRYILVRVVPPEDDGSSSVSAKKFFSGLLFEVVKSNLDSLHGIAGLSQYMAETIIALCGQDIINLEDDEEKTVLYYASALCAPKFVAMLLYRGANPNVSVSPLNVLGSDDATSKRIYQLLISHGADPARARNVQMVPTAAI